LVRMSAGMPGPWSMNATLQAVSSTLTATRMRPPAPGCR
jgi:hypothetical protein